MRVMTLSSLVLAAAAESFCCFWPVYPTDCGSCEEKHTEVKQADCLSADQNTWCNGSGPSPTPAPTPTPTPSRRRRSAPTPAPGTRTPLYLVMRMDDIAAGDYVEERMRDAIEWARENKVKFNFGIITKDWPTGCLDNPSENYCNSGGVKAIYKAYAAGDVLGTGGDETLEIGLHAYAHETWGERWAEKSWMQKDVKKGSNMIRTAFPNAKIRTFTPPQNLANEDTMTAISEQGFDILSTQGTSSCQGYYLLGPCDAGDGNPVCMPKNDIYATTSGFRKVDGYDIFSTPDGCASADYSTQQGISAKTTLGEGKCGCTIGSTVTCSVIANAKNNALKSNGLHWAVNMLHPQNEFPGGLSYKQWLDEFYDLAMSSPEYEIKFIHFQDLVKLRAPGSADDVTV